MGLTFLLLLIIVCGLMLMLWAGVAFVQDKKLFSSAPKDVQEAIQPREERFRGAHAIANEIHLQSPDTIVKVFNVDHAEKDDIVGEVFKSKAVAVGSPTILNGILAGMEGFLYYLKSLKFREKRACVFGCYGWSGEGNRILREKPTDAGFEAAENEVKSSWNPEETDFAKISAMVRELR